MPAKNIFYIGQEVSLKEWDKSTHPKNRMGDSKVLKIETGQRCESGSMVTVENERGDTQRLDSNWLVPISDPELF